MSEYTEVLLSMENRITQLEKAVIELQNIARTFDEHILKLESSSLSKV